MSDLISREALLKTLERRCDQLHRRFVDIYILGRMAGIDDAINEVKNAPAVDTEPVRRGRWKYIAEMQRAVSVPISCRLVCSQCHINKIRHIGEIFNYCPACGAKMDEGVDNGKQEG